MMEISRQRRNDLICLCLVLATIAVYWPVRQFQFVNYDDIYYVYLNPHVRSGVTPSAVAWAFSARYRSNWHPLTWVSHMLDCQLFGLDPGAQHMVNVMFHIGSVLLLFHVLNRMTAAPWRSAFVAALFALHPLHVESVAWIAERKDVLSAFFWMLTMWAYVRHVEKLTVRSSQFSVHYVLALVFFTLGLMAKPMLVTLPFVLLLLDYWPLGRTRWAKPAVGEKLEKPLTQLMAEKLPFLALAAASCVVTVWAQSGAISSLEKLPLVTRLANAVVSYASYLSKAVWPRNLAVFYPYAKLSSQEIVIAVGVLIGISAWSIWKARRQPHFIVGWLWYLGTLIPVIGLVQVGQQSMADRYTYLPLIGIFMVLAWAVPPSVIQQRVSRQIIAGAAAALLGTFAVGCRLQVRYWENTETLFRHALQVTKDNWIAHYNLGFALAQAGNVPKALEHFEEAVRIKPDYADAQYNLGRALILLGRRSEAVSHWGQALQAKPDDIETQNDLARLLATLPRSEGGDSGRAVTLAEQACRLTSNHLPKYLDTLAMAYASAGRFGDAIATGQKAVELARVAGQWPLAGEIETRLEMYRNRRAPTAK